MPSPGKAARGPDGTNRTTGGRYLGFVNEGYNGPTALTVIGDVTEGIIEAIPSVCRDRMRPTRSRSDQPEPVRQPFTDVDAPKSSRVQLK